MSDPTKMDDVDTFAFDPSMKKKRKKKKLVSLEDKDLNAASSTDAAVTETPKEAAPAAEEEQAAASEQAPPKKTVVKDVTMKPSDLEDISGDKYVQLLSTGDIDWSKFLKNKRKADDIADELGALSFDMSRKKKKKTSKKLTLKEVGTAEQDMDEGDIKHTYEELLDNVFSIMRAKNPELAGGEKKQFVIAPPNVVRLGVKRTGFTNFVDICKMLHREREHLLSYLWTELGTSGSIDSSNCLVIKGRFQQRQIESVLRSYIREYVTCHTCKSPNTMLAKQNRLYFLQCEACGSRRTVSSIKHGFQAVTGRRAAMRAKAQ